MLAALIIVFREVLEAGLVVGVVLAATRGLPGRGAWIGLGLVAGVLGACLLALFAGRIANLFEGAGQETLNAAVLLVAVAMLCWHNAWMARHGRDLARELKAVGADVAAGRRPLAALAVVCGVAVLREGSEVVLFLYGVAAAGGVTAGDIVIGGALGIVAGALVSALLYLGLIAIPLRYLFATLTTLITLLAAGLAAQAVDFLQQGGWLDAWSDAVWDTSGLLSQDSLVGRILHTLIGYIDRPTGMELVAYGAVVAVMLVLMAAASRGAGGRRSAAGPG
ncbi:FTR1 family iron permease [Labrys wisconsinensis]|uniref:High-affinity iron transporter n=1 Tax=Labrys wisconsinensis TaxID=425677 RepID=A0ABU0J022_9HYPH|nr:FTR1 family protein [Labrys wisconsinensis]MDQ0467620.1 high-affinity iron transporter [Labrys wisconsinensis]